MAERLHTFASSNLGLDTLSRPTQLQHDHGAFVLRDGPEYLAHQNAAGVFTAQVRLVGANKGVAAMLDVRKDRLLHHQIARKPIQLLNQDQALWGGRSSR